jgi:hypothetical protein
MKTENLKKDELTMKISVPKGKFCDVCPHWSNKHCYKTSRPTYVQNADYNAYCNGNYTSCSLYNATGQVKSGGCYVATCVYGSYDCPEVWTLRRFRDSSLKSSPFGRLFVRLYYFLSPTLVNRFGSNRLFRKTCGLIIDKIVKSLQDYGVDNSLYSD